MNKNVTIDNLDVNQPVTASHAIQQQRPPRARDLGCRGRALARRNRRKRWRVVSTAVVCVGHPIGIGALAALKRFVLQDTFGFPVWTFRNDVHTSQIVEGVNAAALAEAARQFPAVSLQPDDSERAPAPARSGRYG